jgi:hypothetical protein
MKTVFLHIPRCNMSVRRLVGAAANFNIHTSTPEIRHPCWLIYPAALSDPNLSSSHFQLKLEFSAFVPFY